MNCEGEMREKDVRLKAWPTRKPEYLIVLRRLSRVLVGMSIKEDEFLFKGTVYHDQNTISVTLGDYV